MLRCGLIITMTRNHAKATISSSPTSTIEGWGSSGNTNFTGLTPSTGCGSEYVSRCTSVYTTWHLDTCRHSANLCPAFLVAVTYAQLVVVNWTSPVSICPRTGDGRFPTPVLHPGTRCMTIPRPLIFPFNLSNVILRHSSFPHISTPQCVWGFL